VGFGFIRRPDGSKLYVHMKSIGKSVERPKPGDKLSYEVGEGANGRPAAVKVRINHRARSQRPGSFPDIERIVR
jgi:cold shock CspA family protein